MRIVTTPSEAQDQPLLSGPGLGCKRTNEDFVTSRHCVTVVIVRETQKDLNGYKAQTPNIAFPGFLLRVAVPRGGLNAIAPPRLGAEQGGAGDYILPRSGLVSSFVRGEQRRGEAERLTGSVFAPASPVGLLNWRPVG